MILEVLLKTSKRGNPVVIVASYAFASLDAHHYNSTTATITILNHYFEPS